jgi:hypothetical protein
MYFGGKKNSFGSSKMLGLGGSQIGGIFKKGTTNSNASRVKIMNDTCSKSLW